VVLVLITLPGKTTWSALCTGEIVSPHVVLTAAHCVAPSTVGDHAQFQVFIGTSLPMTGPPPPDQLLAVSESHYLSTFGPDANGQDADDVGVLILAAATPIAPLPINQFNLPDSKDKRPVRLVGFGLTDGTDKTGMTAGTRHQAPSYLTNVFPKRMDIWDNEHSNCEGDSGGPALMMVDGKERIVGITQTGYGGCPLKRAQIDTRVDVYANYINGFIAMNDPTLVPAGGACTSDAQCAPLPCLSGVCTQACDPSAPEMCPSGTTCVDTDNRPICAKGHGCAFAGDVPSGPSAWLLLLPLMALVARRARRT
jgi:hypothetical protein